MNDRSFKEELANLETFIFDLDGVFTDNSVELVTGEEPRRTFYVRDAYAVQHAVKEGLRILIMSGGRSKAVEESLQRSGVKEVYMSVADKLSLFRDLCSNAGIDPATTAYMGDDIPDLPVMRSVALPCCPADAAEEVKAISAFISKSNGGRGCVRDLLEQVLKVQGRWLTTRSYTW